MPTTLGAVAKARKMMSKLAKKSGVGRESLYHSLSSKGNPNFKTIFNVIDLLGYNLKLSKETS
ncbi:MAG: putative addiction module antidote protein [Candidatus Margulisbacteria bacterium]|nr:putative addiction module antidote protein [Candidatus Margulisiibacteriota bacterium]